MIQFASDHLVTEVLIHPQLNTLQQCMKNMLGSFTKHRQIINGGYTFAGTGHWVLQDGPYSYSDFTKAFEEYDIQRVMRAYENSISINIHCCSEGDWTQDHLNKEQFSEFCQVKTNDFYTHGPENLKKSNQKNLVKSNKSIFFVK